MSEEVTVDTGRLTNRKCIILFKLWKEKNAAEETRHAARWYLKNNFWAKLVQVIIL